MLISAEELERLDEAYRRLQNLLGAEAIRKVQQRQRGEMTPLARGRNMLGE